MLKIAPPWSTCSGEEHKQAASVQPLSRIIDNHTGWELRHNTVKNGKKYIYKHEVVLNLSRFVMENLMAHAGV